MPDDPNESIEQQAEQKRWKYRNLPPTQLSLEVRHRPGLEDPYITGSLKLKGEVPVRQDLHAGQELTVQVCNADGEVIASGIFEVGLPGFKDVKAKGAGIIGVERVHAAKFQEEE